MDDLDSEWQRKGATLSDKTAREEFGLTQDEIVRAIRAGKLQYREGSIYGNPRLRLFSGERWRRWSRRNTVRFILRTGRRRRSWRTSIGN